MRRTFLLLTVLAAVVLIAWAGWHNLRQREAMQRQRFALTPNASDAGTSGAGMSGMGTSGADATESPIVKSPLLGKSAPAFTLVDLSGKKVSLSDFKGRPLVVNFWGTYCPPCKIEMPWLEDFSKKYASSGFQVIGITYDSEVGKATIGRIVKQLGVTYPILLSDPKVETAYLSDTQYLPMSFYVGRSGKITLVTAGISSKDDLESMVKQTIAEGAK